MRRLVLAVPIAILLVVASCSDSSIFLSGVDEPASVEIVTVPNGSIVPPGAEIPLTIHRDPVFAGDPETVDHLVIELMGGDTVVAEQVVESVDQAVSLPPVLLPEIQPGTYQLRSSYYDGDVLVFSSIITVFVADGSYQLVGLSAYPAAIAPGASGLLTVNLRVPVESNPYLRWQVNGETVREAYLSETGAGIVVTAPEDEGVYPVVVELFPFSPVNEAGEVLPTTVRYAGELVVTESPALAETDLSPEWNYLSLLHFRGDTSDSGAVTELFPRSDTAVIPIGNPELKVEQDIFGYYLDGSSGFTVPAFLLPVVDDRLGPFSMSFRLMLEETLTDACLLSVSGDSGNETLVIDVLADGRLLISLQSFQVTTPVPVVQPGVPALLTISVWPGDEETQVLVFSDGLISTAAVLPVTSSDLHPGALPTSSHLDGWALMPGTTTIGGSDSIRGMIDEFGVYFRDDDGAPATKTGIFHEAMRQSHGDNLVYAEGFEGQAVPNELLVDGEVSVTAGRLVLEGGSRVTFPPFSFGESELKLRAEIEATAGAVVKILVAGTDQVILTLDEPFAAESASLPLLLRFAHSGGSLAITREGAPLDLLATVSPELFSGITVDVANSPENSIAVSVSRVVAYTSRPRIPKQGESANAAE